MTFDTEEVRLARDNAMVIVPQRLVDKIDRNRDRLSRAAFIELCIDTLIESGNIRDEGAAAASFKIPAQVEEPVEPRAAAKPPVSGADEAVSREELDEFKKGVKELLRAYVECFSPEAVTSLNKRETLDIRHLDDLLENR